MLCEEELMALDEDLLDVPWGVHGDDTMTGPLAALGARAALRLERWPPPALATRSRAPNRLPAAHASSVCARRLARPLHATHRINQRIHHTHKKRRAPPDPRA